MSTEHKKNYSYSAIDQEHAGKTNQLDIDYRDSVPTIGVRHFQVFIYFLLCIIAFGFRVTLSVAIVAMTDPKASSNPDVPTYAEWKNKNVILSAFFWGYIIPQVFAGWASNRFGAKWFLVGCMVVQSALGTLVPYTAATYGAAGLMLNRAIQGFSQGFIYPSLTHLLSQWAPPQERSRLGTVVYSAAPFGTVIAIPLSGFIAASWYGWPWVFYLYGSLGVLWCVLMIFFGYNSPAVHPHISETEKRYIEESLGHAEEKPNYPTPWKDIFTSLPLFALFSTQLGFNYCFWTMITQIPTYMGAVMNFDIKQNSLLSSLPYLTLWVLSFVFGFMSDFLVNKNILSRTTARKIFNSIGMLTPAVAIIILAYTESHEYTKAVILLIVAVGITSACYSGWTVNHMDLSPNHAGTLMGITNGFSQCTGAIAPIIVQLLVTHETDPLEWRVVFLITAGINILTGIVFVLFGSGDVQSWNDSEKGRKIIK